MYSSAVIVWALVGHTFAAPTSQHINEEAMTRDGLIINHTSKRGSACANKRFSACAVQPAGSGPVSSPDTPDAFLENADFWDMAVNAQTPSGYTQVMRNVTAAINSNVVNYLSFNTLTSYDTLACQVLCDQTAGCLGFNIYVERDPSVNPDSVQCPNPASTTNYKCALYDLPVNVEEATNCGQWRADFHVVISASNAYNKGLSNVTIANSTSACETGSYAQKNGVTVNSASVNTTSASGTTSASSTTTASSTASASSTISTSSSSTTTPEAFTGAGSTTTINYSMLIAAALGAIAFMSL